MAGSSSSSRASGNSLSSSATGGNGRPAAAAAAATEVAEEEEEEDSEYALQRAARSIGDAAVYAVLGECVGVENGAELASALIDPLPQDKHGRAARNMLGRWVKAELRRTTALASAVALAQAQGSSKRKGDGEERVGTSWKKKKKKRRQRGSGSSDGQSDNDICSVRLHLSDLVPIGRICRSRTIGRSRIN